MHSILCTRILFLILRQQKLKGPDAKPPPEFSSIFSTLNNEKDTTPDSEIDMQDLSKCLHTNEKDGVQKNHEYEVE